MQQQKAVGFNMETNLVRSKHYYRTVATRDMQSKMGQLVDEHDVRYVALINQVMNLQKTVNKLCAHFQENTGLSKRSGLQHKEIKR